MGTGSERRRSRRCLRLRWLAGCCCIVVALNILDGCLVGVCGSLGMYVDRSQCPQSRWVPRPVVRYMERSAWQGCTKSGPAAGIWLSYHEIFRRASKAKRLSRTEDGVSIGGVLSQTGNGQPSSKETWLGVRNLLSTCCAAQASGSKQDPSCTSP